MKATTLTLINEDLGIIWQDAGPWRSYHLDASGETFSELCEDATISEIDQDGGELACYGLDQCDSEIYRSVIRTIEVCFGEFQKRKEGFT